MRAVAYTRVSTEEQATSGLGLAAQRATIATAVLGKGGTIVAELADEGISGSIAADERPGVAEALALIAAGTADTLVVAKLDRLGRSAYDVLGIAQRAEREGWALVVLDLGLDTTTPVGRFTLTILAGVAQLERDLIRQRTREALAAKKARGERVGRPPELDPEVVARVLHLRQTMTLREVADVLNHEGTPSARGGPWSASTVRWVCGRRAA